MGPMAMGGGVLGAVGSIQQGNAQASTLQNSANTANYNAQVQRQQAEQAMTTANSQANSQQVQARQQAGTQRAASAQSGYFGTTAEQLIDQSAANAELDRLNILYGGQTQAQGLEQAAQLSEQKADWQEAQIPGVQMAGYLGAGASALSGYGQSKYYGSKGTLNPDLNYKGY